MMRPVILFVDDSEEVLANIKNMLSEKQTEWNMLTSKSPATAVNLMQSRKIDVVVADRQMPEMSGAALLAKAKDIQPEAVRILLSEQIDIKALMRETNISHRYLTKPCEKETFISTLSRALSMKQRMENTELKAIISKFQILPGPKHTYTALMDELASPNCNAQKLAAIISEDAGFYAKILQLANSAYFGLPTRVSSPVTAVSLLGQDAIKALAAQIGVFGMFDKYGLGNFTDEISKHGLEIADLARTIAEMEGLEEDIQNDAFTAGLLHDVGMLLLAATKPEKHEKCREFAKTEKGDISYAEKKVFGATHADISGYLMALWGIPENIVEAITYHHSAGELDSKELDQATILQASEAITEDKINEKLIQHLENIGKADRLDVWIEEFEKIKQKELEEEEEN